MVGAVVRGVVERVVVFVAPPPAVVDVVVVAPGSCDASGPVSAVDWDGSETAGLDSDDVTVEVGSRADSPASEPLEPQPGTTPTTTAVSATIRNIQLARRTAVLTLSLHCDSSTARIEAVSIWLSVPPPPCSCARELRTKAPTASDHSLGGSLSDKHNQRT